jgi:hypothetical protein
VGSETSNQRLDGRVVMADRTHKYAVAPPYLFRALTTRRESWMVLHPGEVMPEVLEAIPNSRVVWSSFWPSSPDDIIELDLTGWGEHSEVRFRWATSSPPDDRGIAITRQRLNQKLGSDIRGAFTWGADLD